MAVANQRIVYIKRTTNNANKDYLHISNNSINNAVRRLDSKGFLLWLYLVGNKDGWKEELYKVAFCSWCGLSESSYERAWKELKEKGYILESKQHKNCYVFVEESVIKEEVDYIKAVDEITFNDLLKEFDF